MSGDQLEFVFSDPESDREAPPKHPGHFIAEELRKRNWTQADLARIIQRPIPTVSELVTGKKALMPEMAIALGKAFGNGSQIWIHREASYRLHLAESAPSDSNAEEMAELYSVAPVKDLEKRGWIQETDNASDLRSELIDFFGNKDFEINFAVSTRRTDPLTTFSAAQKAWLMRATQLARVVPVKPFVDFTFSELDDLRRLAKSVESVGAVSQFLAYLGIRFVIVEPLPKSRIDGAAFWLDEQSPVIALSLRYDRIDSFWHTLAHELSHISNRDDTSLDIDLVGSERSLYSMLSEIEKRADRQGSEWLIPKAKLDSFIRRNSPFFSKEKIQTFAARMGVHPGIVVGQLHHEQAIEFKHHRSMLSKVRRILSSVATTDGYGAPLIKRKQTA